jgi:hypothetical protein
MCACALRRQNSSSGPASREVAPQLSNRYEMGKGAQLSKEYAETAESAAYAAFETRWVT